MTVDGAELTLAKALTQDGARDLAGMIEKDKEKRRDKDRRNLHLAAVSALCVAAQCCLW